MFALKKWVAIEIAGKTLQCVAVSRGLRGYEVTARLALDEFESRDPLALRPQVDEFFRRARADRHHTVVALPRAGVVLRTLHFPEAVSENLANILDYQVENFEPIDRTELAYAHQLISRGDPPGKLEVLLAMTRRAEIERRQHFFAALGIRPRAMVCATFGLARILQPVDSVAARENNFAARINENDFELLAVLAGKIRAAKRFEFPESSERVPHGLSAQAGEQIAQELIRTRAELRLEEKDLHNVYVTGVNPDAVVAEVRAKAVRHGGLPLRLLRAPVGGGLRSRLSPAEFQAAAPAIGVAILAMQKSGLSTNLMDHPEVSGQPQWAWAPTYALCGAALLMAGATAARPSLQQRQFLSRLNAEIARLQPQVRRMEQIESQAGEAQKKAAVLAAQVGRDARNLEALRELSEILPDTAWINELSVHGDTIDLSGFADSATALVPLLDQSPLFQDATLASGITRTQQGKELFHIRAKFKF